MTEPTQAALVAPSLVRRLWVKYRHNGGCPCGHSHGETWDTCGFCHWCRKQAAASSPIRHARELLAMIETLALSGRPQYLPDIASHARKALDLLAPALEASSTSETALTGQPIAGNTGYRKGDGGDAE